MSIPTRYTELTNLKTLSDSKVVTGDIVLFGKTYLMRITHESKTFDKWDVNDKLVGELNNGGRFMPFGNYYVAEKDGDILNLRGQISISIDTSKLSSGWGFGACNFCSGDSEEPTVDPNLALENVVLKDDLRTVEGDYPRIRTKFRISHVSKQIQSWDVNDVFGIEGMMRNEWETAPFNVVLTKIVDNVLVFSQNGREAYSIDRSSLVSSGWCGLF